MKIAALSLSAALLAFASMTPATAAPSAAVGHATALEKGSGVMQAQYIQYNKYSKKRYKGHKKGHRHGYRAGHRYKHAPKGWHRYSSRPSFWQTRGCIVVGPVWFCP